jgi:hypothetical protein
MAGVGDEVYREIVSLRKGLGVGARNWNSRLGPHLRRLAGAQSATGRLDGARLHGRLHRCANRLGPEARQLALVGLNLVPCGAGQASMYEARLVRLAESLHVAPRTARRRVEEAFQLLAGEIERELTPEIGERGWVLREFSSRVRLDLERPKAHEVRRIVATRDGLDRIKAWWDFPASDTETPQVAVEISYGARVEQWVNSATGRQALYVRLPRRLSLGEECEFGLDLTVTKSQMRPHYIFTPEIACDLFRLRVRFGRHPQWVREVRGETVRAFDAAEPGPGTLELDKANEVDLTFPEPQRYLGYGAQWQL